MKRVSKGAAQAANPGRPAPFDTAFATPFDKLRTPLQPTQDANLMTLQVEQIANLFGRRQVRNENFIIVPFERLDNWRLEIISLQSLIISMSLS